MVVFFFFQAEDGIRDGRVTGVQTCALPILTGDGGRRTHGMCGYAAGMPTTSTSMLYMPRILAAWARVARQTSRPTQSSAFSTRWKPSPKTGPQKPRQTVGRIYTVHRAPVPLRVRR